MLDPSLTALLDHLNWSPPAITQPAPISASDQHRMAAYADYVTSQEVQLAAWVEQGLKLRERLWTSIASANLEFDLEGLTTMIEQFEDGLKHEARVLARKEKQARRDERELSGPLKTFVQRQQSRLLGVARDFYGEGKDFASFLRAVRAEADPGSRGGPKFADAAELQEFLLKSSA